jgi:hypothetical protein
MIERYNKSALADHFDYNDPLIAEWADNVFEKIRQSGELAGYVERNKYVRAKFDADDSQARFPVVETDGRFTFGNKYSGDTLTLSDGLTDNLGKTFTVEFDILFNEANFADVELFDGYVLIKNDSSIKIGNVTFSSLAFAIDILYKIKIVRNSYVVSLYIDGVSKGTKQLSADVELTYTVLYHSHNIVNTVAPDYNDDYNTDYLSSNL